jgi:hypothetical protein
MVIPDTAVVVDTAAMVDMVVTHTHTAGIKK